MPVLQHSIDVVLAYHSSTKHHLHRFAASLGYLDWATQPDPFRTFTGAERIALPLMTKTPGASYGDLHIPGGVAAARLDLNSVGILFELALGLSAWKEYKETRWALRCNPSSGNLHPTEGYAILPEMPGLEPAGIYHYVSRDHCLERRCVLQDPSSLAPDFFLVGLSSIHWREAWKYGERAFRYCQHDLGHAIAAVRYAAATLGWSATLLENASDPAIAGILGLARSESFSEVSPQDREHPGVLLLVGPASVSHRFSVTMLGNALRPEDWTGRANALNVDHVHWPVIDTVAEAALRQHEQKDEDPAAPAISGGLPDFPRKIPLVDAAHLIKQRRSAVALDDVTAMPLDTFYGMLDRLLPRPGVPPWDVWPWPPHVHCAVFVHRIQDLPPGLYLFERSAAVHDKLRSAMRTEFVFERPDGCPEHLRLFRLSEGDLRQQAQIVSCHQKIAGAGALSLGMIAEFAGSIQARGAWWYRRLFWESGLLGQVLYLEAEAAGIRGTGIGCYFDDAFHSILGIQGNQFQSLYHFTIGGPVEDVRLMTRPGYFHLEEPGSAARRW
jgi:SagB-type dehydrogenase family enzyme